MKNFSLFVTFIVAAILSSFWSGLAFAKLWLWFIVPAFGLAPLRVPVAAGMCLMVAFLTMRVQPDEPKLPFEEKVIACIANGVLKPLVFLAFGFVVKLFV